MKKLMFAIAAIAAGTVIADVESANVVGYNGVGLENDGSQMTCATFKNMGANKGMWLSEVTIDGYHDCQEFKDEEGTFGAYVFIAKVLGPEGTIDGEYFWKEAFDPYSGDEGSWQGDAHWELMGGDHHRIQGKNDETDVWLDFGTSLWLQAPEGFEGSEGYSFQNSGEVLNLSQAVPMANDGSKAIGNMFCIDAWLSEVTITGYHDCQEFKDEEGTFGAYVFIAKVLGPGGTIDGEYFWKEAFDPYSSDQGEWQGDAHWELMGGDHHRIQGKNDETDLRIRPGTGLWCQSPEVFDGSEGYFMVFKGFDL